MLDFYPWPVVVTEEDRRRFWTQIAESESTAVRYWCLHCQGVYEVAMLRVTSDWLYYCANPNCNGAGPYWDLFPWEPMIENHEWVPFVEGVRSGQHVDQFTKEITEE